MQTPTVGRIVLVFVDATLNNGADVAPAIITRVWTDEMVNVRVLLDGKSEPLWFTSLALYADRDIATEAPTYTTASDGKRLPAAAFWPPRV